MWNAVGEPTVLDMTLPNNNWAFAGMVLNQTVVPDIVTGNFKHIANGIVLRNSTLTIDNAKFYELPDPAHPATYLAFEEPAGAGGTGMRCGNGIYAKGKFPAISNNLQVTNSLFKLCRKAVKVEDAYTINVSGNHLNYCQTGILINRCVNSTITIENNYIRMLGFTPSPFQAQPFFKLEPQSIGIAMNYCRQAGWSPLKHSISNNTVDVERWEWGVFHGPSSSNYGFGIVVTDDVANSYPTLSILHNIVTIKRGVEGVTFNGVNGGTDKNVSVQENTVTAISNQIRPNNCFNVHNSTNIQILSNTAQNIGPIMASNQQYPRGFCIAANTLGGLRLECNSAYNLRTGFRFEGRNQNTDFKTNEIGRGNIGNYLGVQITASGLIGDQSQKGNRWMGSYGTNPMTSGAAAWNQSQLLDQTGNGAASRFVTPASGSSDQSPTLDKVTPSFINPINTGNLNVDIKLNGWFRGDPFYSDLPKCSGGSALPALTAGTNPILSEFERQVMEGKYNPDYFTEVNKWDAKEQVLGALGDARDSLIFGSPEYDFYQQNHGTEIERFVQVADAKKHLRDYTSVHSDQLQTSYLRQSQYERQLDTLDAAARILTVTAEPDDTAILNVSDSLEQLWTSSDTQSSFIALPDSAYIVQRELLYALIDSERVLQEAIHSAEQAIFEDRRLQLIDSNWNLSDLEYYERNKKQVTDAYLHSVVTDSSYLDEEGYQQLYDIAHSCYIEGGMAVFEARALLNWSSPEAYDDYDICDQVGIALKKEPDTSISICTTPEYHVYPIPAGNSVFVTVKNDFFNGKHIQMLNYLGEVVLDQWEFSGNRVVIDTKNIASGAYQIRVLQQGKHLFSQKISICH